MFCFTRFLVDIKSPLTPELYFKIYIEMSRQALLYTAISALRPWQDLGMQKWSFVPKIIDKIVRHYFK